MNTFVDPHAMTPYRDYYQPLSPDQVITEPNYTEYDLLCVRSRLQPWLDQHKYSHLTVTWVHVPRADDSTRYMGLGIRLVDAGADVKIPPEDLISLQQAVDRILDQPDHCNIFTWSSHLYLDHRLIPSSWIASMLRFVRLDDSEIDGLDPRLEDGSIMVNLRSSPIFDQEYQRLANLVGAQIREWYRRGVVVCGDDFARRYDLVWHDQTIDTSGTLTLTAYRPTWDDWARIPDRVEYLRSRMADDMLE